VRESRFDDRGQEFPRVDERLIGKRHRYGYAPTGEVVFGNTLLKHDFLRNSTQSLLRRRKGGRRVHLPSFVP